MNWGITSTSERISVIMKTNLSLLIFMLFFAQPGYSQTVPEPAPAPAPTTTSVSKTKVLKADKGTRVQLKFEDELVSGKPDSPDSTMIQLRKNPNFKKLIKIRENFNPEMERSKNVFQK